jgi:predicted Zn-dependent protease with MMP-like domain
MVTINDEEFSNLIDWAMDQLPQEYIKRLQNVAIVYEDEPTAEQRQKLKLHCNQTLYGLYEGVPLPQRQGRLDYYMPDKITIFKGPISAAANNEIELKAQILHTLWHEIAHHFGLNHDRIHEIERNWRKP